jgi:hypothetical protein
MKSSLRIFAIASTFLIAAILAVPATAQDKAKPAAAKADEKKAAAIPGRKVLFENDKVLAYEARFKPGEGSPARERPPRIVRALSDGTMLRTYGDGKTEKIEWKTGDTKWLPKDNFANKNVGKTEVVLYIVEPK